MENIVKYYSSFDEWGRLDREPIEFLVNLHYIKQYLPKNGRILDNGAGPGKYSIELAKLGYQVTLTDLTPRLVELAEEKAAEQDFDHHAVECRVADARDLSMFPDHTFDASLMLGPMYHLQTEDDRDKAITELFRVTKENINSLVSILDVSSNRAKDLKAMAELLNPSNEWTHSLSDIINALISHGLKIEFLHEFP
ncbi:MAG: class I SAM-dependent methyltransferase [Paenibacillaceae bacterium]